MKSIRHFSSVCALVLSAFSTAAQAVPSAVTCAAALSIPPTSKVTSPDFEKMQQYFQAIANVKLSATSASKAIAAEISGISKKTLEERMSISRSCGMLYIQANPGSFSGLNKTI